MEERKWTNEQETEMIRTGASLPNHIIFGFLGDSSLEMWMVVSISRMTT